MNRGAILSTCGTYRYRLARRWGPGERVIWVMLNPSIADARVDDHTIRKCIGFARRWGYHAVEVVNLFAWRATDPRELLAAFSLGRPIVGHDNDRHIREAVADRGPVVAAWGAHAAASINSRDQVVASMLPEPRCLGMTQAGEPRHPLMLAYNTPLVPFGR